MRPKSHSHSCSPQCSLIPCFPGVEIVPHPFVISDNEDLIISFSEELRGDKDVCHTHLEVCAHEVLHRRYHTCL